MERKSDFIEIFSKINEAHTSEERIIMKEA